MNYTAIDIGGTFIKYARMNEYAEFLEKGKTATPYDPALFFQAIKEILSNYPGSQGICISCPGLIDVETGDVFHGGSLHFLHGRNLKREIGAFCGLPVEIENDAKCAGLAEAVLGNASGVQDCRRLGNRDRRRAHQRQARPSWQTSDGWRIQLDHSRSRQKLRLRPRETRAFIPGSFRQSPS